MGRQASDLAATWAWRTPPHTHPTPLCLFGQAMEPAYAELARQLAGSGVKVAKFQADVEREFAATKFGLETFPTIVLLPQKTPGACTGGDQWLL